MPKGERALRFPASLDVFSVVESLVAHSFISREDAVNELVLIFGFEKNLCEELCTITEGLTKSTTETNVVFADGKRAFIKTNVDFFTPICKISLSIYPDYKQFLKDQGQWNDDIQPGQVGSEVLALYAYASMQNPSINLHDQPFFLIFQVFKTFMIVFFSFDMSRLENIPKLENDGTIKDFVQNASKRKEEILLLFVFHSSDWKLKDQATSVPIFTTN